MHEFQPDALFAPGPEIRRDVQPGQASMRAVGILGGMSPRATLLLMQKVLDATPAQEESDHVPLIVYQNPQVPPFSATAEDASPLPVLQNMATDLTAAGAQALALPCAASHAWAAGIRAVTDLPILDMLAAADRVLAEEGRMGARIGVLAQPDALATGVFDRLTHPWTTPPDSGGLAALARALRSGAPPASLAPALTRIAYGLCDRTDHLLIACPELSRVAPYLPPDIRWTDSLDCLALRIIAFAQGG